MSGSEVAHLRQRIAEEYAAAQQALTGLSCGIACHAFIEAKMHRVGEYQQQLAGVVGKEQAIALLVETIDALPQVAIAGPGRSVEGPQHDA